MCNERTSLVKSTSSILKWLHRQKLHPWAGKDTTKPKDNFQLQGYKCIFTKAFCCQTLLAMSLPSWLTFLMPLAGS